MLSQNQLNEDYKQQYKTVLLLKRALSIERPKLVYSSQKHLSHYDYLLKL